MNGLLLIDKPKGWSSFDVVAKVRGTVNKYLDESPDACACDRCKEAVKRAESGTEGVPRTSTGAGDAADMQERGSSGRVGPGHSATRHRVRVGHAGTLDPMATGLLIVLVGKACKQQNRFMKLDKVYEAEVTLGVISTTDDAEGDITCWRGDSSPEQPSEKQIHKVLQQFIGEISQLPPQHSAIKVNGQRAYKLARSGEQVELKSRQVTIYSIENAGYEYPKLSFTIHVSSGTYIRSLARDIGAELGVGGYLSSLRRASIGRFKVNKAISPELKRQAILQNLQSID